MQSGNTDPDPFDLCRRFGTAVHLVDGMVAEMLYLPEHHVAFVRAGLGPEVRAEVADWLLCECLSERASLERP